MTAIPHVSVVLITFNHQPYVADALRSIFEQRTDFPVEVIISDDHSTDATPGIIDSFLANLATPHTVRVLHRPANLGKRGMNNFVRTLGEAAGTYVALLEGDDYWTSRDKLATQARLLDTHPDVTLCGHRTDVVHVMKGNCVETRPRPFTGTRFFETEYVLRSGNIIHTSSFMFRRDPSGDLVRYLDNFECGDLPLLMYQAMQGKVGVLSECMSHYRRTGSGLCSTPNNAVIAGIQLRVFQTLLRMFPEHAHIFRSHVASAQVMEASSSLRHGGSRIAALQMIGEAWRNDPLTVLRRLPTVAKLGIRCLLAGAERHAR